MTAHVAGIPVEEVVPTLLSGVGAGVVLTFRSIRSRRRGHLRRDRDAH